MLLIFLWKCYNYSKNTKSLVRTEQGSWLLFINIKIINFAYKLFLAFIEKKLFVMCEILLATVAADEVYAIGVDCKFGYKDNTSFFIEKSLALLILFSPFIFTVSMITLFCFQPSGFAYFVAPFYFAHKSIQSVRQQHTFFRFIGKLTVE